MAKNKKDTFGVADDLQFTQDTQEKHEKHNTQDTQGAEQYAMTPEEVEAVIEQSKEILKNFTPKQGRPKKKEEEKLRGYRYNLNLDRDLKEYLHEAAWKKRTSITQYINDLIRADMENDAEWKKENE